MIQVSRVSKRYGRFGRPTLALDDVSLEVQKGETLGLIGPNGAGKTTLLSCLLGFLRPDSGSIQIDGKASRRSVGAREHRLYARATRLRSGADRTRVSRSPLAARGRRPPLDRNGNRAAAERVGLELSVLSRKLRTYSRGMLQRIGVAQATLRDPQWLFLDEPASGTDPMGVAVVRERILEAKSRGATIVLELPPASRSRKSLRPRRLHRPRAADSGGDASRRCRDRPPDSPANPDGPRRRGSVGPDVRRESRPESNPPAPSPSPAARDEEVARAVASLVQVGIPVFEARVSADLEQLFRKGA